MISPRRSLAVVLLDLDDSATDGTPRFETMKSMYQPGGATLAVLGSAGDGETVG
jgi:hypothetical protein